MPKVDLEAERIEFCVARIKVTPRGGAPHGAGFACAQTGGHCLPDELCDERRVRRRQRLALEEEMTSWK